MVSSHISSAAKFKLLHAATMTLFQVLLFCFFSCFLSAFIVAFSHIKVFVNFKKKSWFDCAIASIQKRHDANMPDFSKAMISTRSSEGGSKTHENKTKQVQIKHKLQINVQQNRKEAEIKMIIDLMFFQHWALEEHPLKMGGSISRTDVRLNWCGKLNLSPNYKTHNFII